MAPRNLINERSMKRSSSSSSSCSNKGAWTAEEDRKLAEFVKTHGAKKWKSIPVQAGLNRCGKSCRFRWLNYLRPNIKRGNISDQEEDLILRLHKLLGNRWSLIARRLPGRTDNEIKNYWNSHLSKKMKQNKYPCTVDSSDHVLEQQNHQFDDHDRSLVEEPSQAVGVLEKESANYLSGESEVNLETGFDIDEFFDFSTDRFQNLEWMTEFFGQDYQNLSNHKY